MRNAQLFCWMMFVTGTFVSGFGVVWSMGINHDPSNFFLAMALGIVMMTLAQVGQIVLKQGKKIEELNKALEKSDAEMFEFIGWTRDKLR